MKKQLILILTFILLIVQVTFSQPGTLDCDFDADGRVVTDFNNNHDAGRAVAVQTDQKIVVAGISDNGANKDFALARYNIDGTLDNTFGEGGKVITDINNNDYSHTIAIQTDGKILVAGHSYPSDDYDVTIVRYNTDGSLDNSFGTDGIATIVRSGEDQCRAMAVQTDGKIVIAGFLYNMNNDFSVYRFNDDGSPDVTFGSSGYVQTEVGDYDDFLRDVAIQPDGQIILAGYCDNGTDVDIALVRFTSTGELDGSFGENGIVIMPVGSSDDVAESIILQNDGKIIITGHMNNGSDRDILITRFNTDGTLDNTFDSDGIVTIPVGDGNEYCEGSILQSDGKILVSGYSHNGDDYDFFVLRCNSDGTLDDTFGEEGIVITPFGDANDYGKDMTVQADERIVVAGFTVNTENDDFAVARYLSGLSVGVVNFSIDDNLMLIYPNPVQDRVTLEYELTCAETISIELYNIQGKLVQAFVSQEARSSGAHEENLCIGNTIPAGSYLLVISNETGRKAIHISKK